MKLFLMALFMFPLIIKGSTEEKPCNFSKLGYEKAYTLKNSIAKRINERIKEFLYKRGIIPDDIISIYVDIFEKYANDYNFYHELTPFLSAQFSFYSRNSQLFNSSECFYHNGNYTPFCQPIKQFPLIFKPLTIRNPEGVPIKKICLVVSPYEDIDMEIFNTLQNFKIGTIKVYKRDEPIYFFKI